MVMKRPPADRHAVLSWEQRNSCLLQEDLKGFYLTSDGFDLTWSVRNDNTVTTLGKMHLNPISHLVQLGQATVKTPGLQPSLSDLETDSDLEDSGPGPPKPSFTGPFKIFELDYCDGHGKVCLVYRTASAVVLEPRVEVWFLDRSLRWHFLAPSFLAYYRLMLVHLGLPQWQYTFTDIGLSQQAKQWFHMYTPLRLEIDMELLFEGGGEDSPHPQSILDVNKVFKGKPSVKKASGPTPPPGLSQPGKKKQSVSSAKSSSSTTGRQASTSSSQGSTKSK